MIYLLASYGKLLFGILVFTLVVTGLWMFIYVVNRNEIVKKSFNNNFFPSLSVIIPMHNEEKDIQKTLRSIFNNKYPKRKLEVVVIDDASTDKSASLAKKFPIKLITNKKQIGKVSSLNRGISKARGEIIVTMDADSLIEKNTLSLLVGHFKDKKVGAVAGVYKTRYENNILEKMQSLEYLWFSLTRKLQEMLGCVLIIPGALGAFRKSVLKKVKGFDSDTMIEDYDITIKIHKTGYKIKCDKDAFAFVCAPSTLSDFIKQRTRWFRGGLQVYRKHSDVFRGRAGIISLLWMIELLGISIQLLVFSIIGYEVIRNVLIYSFADIILKIETVFVHIITMNINLVEYIMFFAGILFLIGIVNVILSINLTKDSYKKLLLYIPMIVYSGLISLIFLKAIIEELFGRKKVWSSQHGKC